MMMLLIGLLSGNRGPETLLARDIYLGSPDADAKENLRILDAQERAYDELLAGKKAVTVTNHYDRVYIILEPDEE